MLGLSLFVVGVAALDSLNPSTLGPALALAAGRPALRDVTAFAAGVFAVSSAGGAVLLFGPGRELLARVATPSPHTRHVLELAVGAVVCVAALAFWLLRARVARRLDAGARLAGSSAFLLGAAIMLVELPTAFPYFAALLAVVEARRGAAAGGALVVAYNVVFVAPLLATLVVTAVGGRGAASALRAKLERRAPVLVPAVLAVVGVTVVGVGAAGLA